MAESYPSARAFECPSCGRVQARPGTCRGPSDDPHAVRKMEARDDLRESLHLDEKVR